MGWQTEPGEKAGCAGWGAGVQGWPEGSGVSGRCAGPRRSSGQARSLASAVREGDRLYLGTRRGCV